MKTIIVLLLLVIAQISNSQICLKNNLLVSPDSAVAYTQQANILKFSGIDTSQEHQLFFEKESLKAVNKNHFLFIPKPPGFYLLDLYQKKEHLGQFKIRVEVLKNVKITLGNLTDTMVALPVLLNNLFFKATYYPQLVQYNNNVIDFEMKITKANGLQLPNINRDSIFWHNIGLLEYIESKSEDYSKNGFDNSFLDKYLEEEYLKLYHDPLFSLELVATIASLE